MSWRAEELLLLLLIVPVLAGLLVLAWWMRKRATEKFGNPEIVRSMIAGRSGAWRATRGVLLVVALGLALLALAGPQYGSRTRMMRKRGVDVVIALDFSKSMLARDVRPTRIDRAKAEITRLLQELDGDRVGVIAFAGETMEFPLTHDYAAIELFMRDLGPYDMPVGGTAIGRALVSAQRLLERGQQQTGTGRDTTREERSQGRSRVVILMTDGEDHEGDPLSAARELAEAGVKVYTIGIGSRTGEPIPTFAPDGTWTGYMRDENQQVVTTALTASNEQQLREIAEATGGKYFRAGRGGVGVDRIRAELRRMKQEERRTRRVTINEDRYALVLLPAFLLIVLEGLLPEAWIGRRRRRKVPT